MSVVANNVNGGGSSTKDTLLTKIFVGGLPYQTSDESLRDFFCQFGEIDEAVVIMDRVTGKSKGKVLKTLLFICYLFLCHAYRNTPRNKLFHSNIL